MMGKRIIHDHVFREWLLDETHMGEWSCIYCGVERSALDEREEK
jgi:hypothetical protein